MQNNSSESIDSLGGWKFHIVIIKKSWIYLLTLLINFSTTLTVFPAVVALVKPTSLGRTSKSKIEHGTTLQILSIFFRNLRKTFNTKYFQNLKANGNNYILFHCFVSFCTILEITLVKKQQLDYNGQKISMLVDTHYL